MVLRGGSSRRFLTMVLLVAAGACSQPKPQPVANTSKPADAQHAGITTPHGDHTPRHGGMVLMNGEVHYEVVLDRAGKHHIWFSNAVREDLPASVASKVMMIVTRPRASDELLALQIDENGESWVAVGQPVAGNDTMVKIAYDLGGKPFEVEIPFVK
jgi:hypothetical protein